MAVRNAASVLPEPVGAAINAWSPARIALQPSIWAGVGGRSPKHSVHQRCRTGRKSGGSSPARLGADAPERMGSEEGITSLLTIPERPLTIDPRRCQGGGPL